MKIGNLEVYGIIYKIINKVNGKVYIGQTTNKYGFDGRYSRKGVGIERVYNYHLMAKARGKHYNDYLLNSIIKYGFDNFEVTKILDVAFSLKELNVKEITYIKIFDSYKNGYNYTSGGEGTKSVTSHNADRVVAFGRGFEFEFVSKTKGAEFFGLKTATNIGDCCEGKSSYVGMYNENRIIWRCYDDYQQLTEEEKYSLILESENRRKKNNHMCRKIIMTKDSIEIEFISIRETCDWLVANDVHNNFYTVKSGVHKCLKGINSNYKGYSFRYL